MDHQLELQKVHNRRVFQQESLIASSDSDVIKIHLQSSLSKFDPNEKILTTTGECGADHKER